MKRIMKVMIGIGVVIGILTINSSIYVVDETKQVVITKFGKIIGEPVVTAGLKFKMPFIHTANFLEKRYLEWDGFEETSPTADKKFIVLDTFARWRISDPVKFLENLQTMDNAFSRMDDILDGAARKVLSSHNLIESIRSTNSDLFAERIEVGREQLAMQVTKLASPKLEPLGIELIDFQLKRLRYVEEVRKSIFARMISERNKEAARFISTGDGMASEILGKRDREYNRLISEATWKSKEIQGEADAKAAKIYADAANIDPKFYIYYRSLQALEKSIDSDTVLTLSSKNDVFKLLQEGAVDTYLQ